MSSDTPEYLLWFDFETTGLDPHTDLPIEVAAVVTTADTLTVIDGYETLIWTSPSKVETCGARDMHEASGLLAAWHEAQKDSRSDAEMSIVKMLDERGIQTVTLAGSGVATFDLPRIRHWMPTLAARLTYHVHDVGVMRRAYKRATGTDLVPQGVIAHRAMADVKSAIEQGRAFADLYRASAHHEPAAAPRSPEQPEPTHGAAPQPPSPAQRRAILDEMVAIAVEQGLYDLPGTDPDWDGLEP